MTNRLYTPVGLRVKGIASVSHSTLSPNQSHWSDLWTSSSDYGGRVPPGVLVIVAYTVPTGYNLIIGGGVVSCEASGIQNIALVGTPGILGDFRYDMRGDIILGPQVATVLEAGTPLTYIVYNNDDVPRHFSVSLMGILEVAS